LRCISFRPAVRGADLSLPPPLNLVERWFREITDKRIRRGTFRSVPQLIEAIMAYMDHHNEAPTPFTWTAQADVILAKVARAKARLDKLPSV